MAVHSMLDGREEVSTITAGRVSFTPLGFDLGLPQADGPLADFREAKGSFANTSSLLVTAGNGRSVQLRYDGR